VHFSVLHKINDFNEDHLPHFCYLFCIFKKIQQKIKAKNGNLQKTERRLCAQAFPCSAHIYK